MREFGRNYVKYLKRGWSRTEGRGKQILKRGANWVKGGELEPPYKTMYPAMEHLSNDHEDCANQHENSHKLMQ